MSNSLINRLNRITETSRGPNLLQAAVFLKTQGSTLQNKVKFLRSQGFTEQDIVNAINVATGSTNEGKLSSLLASAAVAGALLTAPINPAYAADLNDVSKIWDIVSSVVNTAGNITGGRADSPRTQDVNSVLQGLKVPAVNVNKDVPSNKGRAGRYDASDDRDFTAAMAESDVGKYFLIKNTRTNKEVVVKCTDVDKDGYSSDKIIKLSKAAFEKLGGSDHDTVLDDVVVSELKQ